MFHCVCLQTLTLLLQNKEDKNKVETSEGQPQEKTTLIHKALKKLMKGVNLSEERGDESELISDNNNEELLGGLVGNNIMEQEEEEEALSESEIRESNLKSLDFQTMYQSFMSGSVSEDSDGSKEAGAGSVNEDGSINFNLSDSNSPLSGGKKTCPYCFQQLSWHALSRHIRDMHRAKSDLVTCKYCMKTFRNKNSLGCHIWRFHKRGKELIGGLKEQSYDN